MKNLNKTLNKAYWFLVLTAISILSVGYLLAFAFLITILRVLN